MQKPSIMPPFINRIDLAENAEINTSVELKIFGQWPTPNWKYLKTDIKFEGNIVKVAYLGERKPGMAAQVLKPMNATVILTFEHPGEYVVQVKNRLDIISTVITVFE